MDSLETLSVVSNRKPSTVVGFANATPYDAMCDVPKTYCESKPVIRQNSSKTHRMADKLHFEKVERCFCLSV